jgi:beta-N-acetylhexosaminidase
MVDIYVKNRRRAPFGGLFLTFVLGVVIGFSIGYACFSGKSAKPSESASPASPPISDAASAPESSQKVEPAVPPAESVPTQETIAKESGPKPGNFLFVGVDAGPLSDDVKAFLKEIHPGGVILKGEKLGSVEETSSLVKAISEAMGGESPLFAVEQEGGKLNPLGISGAPSAKDLGRKKSVDAARDAGRACGAAASERGIRVVFGPVLNVRDRSAKGVKEEDAYISADRVLGSDQGHVERFGMAFAEGVAEKGALPFVKYYPGVGFRREGQSGASYRLEANSRKLAELMYPFSEAAARDVAGVIVAPIAVPELDRKEPDRPASLSPVLVNAVLREKFGYKGFILAADMSGVALGASCPPERAAVAALLPGCDGVVTLDAKPDQIRAICAALQEAIDKGELPKERLAESASRWNVLRGGSPEGVSPPEEGMFASPAKDVSQVEENTGTVEADKNARTPAVVDAKPAEESAPAADKSKVKESAAEKPKAKASTTSAPQPPNTEKVLYEIERGDSLSKISKKYGVKPESIASWNGLSDSAVRFGDKLTIYRPLGASGAKPTAPESTESAPAANSKADSAIAPTSESAASPSPKTESATEIHEVAKGESISKIAARYNTTVQHLVEMNKLEDPDHLVAGQKLNVPANLGVGGGASTSPH